MYKFAPVAILLVTASVAAGEETRRLDAHEHGVGSLNIAVDGDRIAMEFHAPGADIVGFEYAATTAQDRAKVDAAVAVLARPLDLFTLPAAAGCSVVEARASLESGEAHDDHEDGDQAHEEHAGHGEDDHNDHAHDDHNAHDDHDHDGHDDHDLDGNAEQEKEAHDHAQEDADHDHKDEANHTEFHAEYTLTCADPAEANRIRFGYFDTFQNAQELEVQVITHRGATAFEVVRDTPTLDLRDMF